MTTNVPQDVIDDLELVRAVLQGFQDCMPKSDGLAAYRRLKEYFDQLRDQRACGEVVEPVAWMHNSPNRVDVIATEVKELLEKVYRQHRTTSYIERPPVRTAEHYTIPLFKTTLDWTAGMMKAAEIIRAKVDPDKTQISEQWNGLCNDFADDILSAIPKESADALKEYVRPLLEESFIRGAMDTIGITSNLAILNKAKEYAFRIVNSILGASSDKVEGGK